MVPNRTARWCTRILKIEPYEKFLLELTARGPVVSHVGLRADEEHREGGVYGHIPGVTQRFFLRELGKDRAAVEAANDRRGIQVPERTDCRKCYAQQIGEWFILWLEDRPSFDQAVAFERMTGHTFRQPKIVDDVQVTVTRYGLTYAASWRDTWPVRLEDMAILFERGIVPPTARVQRDLFKAGACRVCAM
jgi:hypothetical protein